MQKLVGITLLGLLSAAIHFGFLGQGLYQDIPELQVGDNIQFNAGVKVRTCAGTGCSVLRGASAGEKAVVIGGPVSADGYSWVEVELNEDTTEGWVANGDGWITKIGESGGDDDDDGDYISQAQLAYIWERDDFSQFDLDELNECMGEYEITSHLRIQHFMAQISHESGAGEWKKEFASGEAYEGRQDLGNIYPGDGPKYKGAGYLQMTGRINYQSFSDYIKDQEVMDGVDYVADTYPATSAGFWWQDNDMNSYIDSGASIDQVGAKVNGRNPPNGAEERRRYYQRAEYAMNNL